jgi:hypothetical protein
MRAQCQPQTCPHRAAPLTAREKPSRNARPRNRPYAAEFFDDEFAALKPLLPPPAWRTGHPLMWRSYPVNLGAASVGLLDLQPPAQGADPCRQFGRRYRLGDVVICTELERDNTVHKFVAGGNNNDSDVALACQLTNDDQARTVSCPHIQEDDRWLFEPHMPPRLYYGASGLHMPARRSKGSGDSHGGLSIAIYYQGRWSCPRELVHPERNFFGHLTCHPSLDRPGGRLPALFGQRGPCAADRFHEARRRFVADPAMRPNLAVVSTPSLAFRPRVVEAHEPVRIQALRPELPVQARDQRVVRRTPRPGEIERHAVQPLQNWCLRVDTAARSAVLTMTDGTSMDAIIRQEIDYTDFPLDEIALWLCAKGNLQVLMLPCEY